MKFHVIIRDLFRKQPVQSSFYVTAILVKYNMFECSFQMKSEKEGEDVEDVRESHLYELGTNCRTA
jgi:hypothetical protein